MSSIVAGAHSCGKRLCRAEVMEEIAAKTDGIPLFVEELTKTILELGALRETENAFELTGSLSSLAIPSTLHDSLMARLDRLQPVKEVAQAAACIGREFDHRLLKDALIIGRHGPSIRARPIGCGGAGLPARSAETAAVYIFKHALVRDAAYESLLKTRRRSIHGKLLSALEDRDGSRAGTARASRRDVRRAWRRLSATYARPARLLRHNRPIRRQSPMWLAAICFDWGDAGIFGLWHQVELELQLQLAQLYMTKIGYSANEARQAFARAKVLRELTGDRDLLLPVTYGLWIGHYIRSEHKQRACRSRRRIGRRGRPRRGRYPHHGGPSHAGRGHSWRRAEVREAADHLETSLKFLSAEQSRRVCSAISPGAQHPGSCLPRAQPLEPRLWRPGGKAYGDCRDRGARAKPCEHPMLCCIALVGFGDLPAR